MPRLAGGSKARRRGTILLCIWNELIAEQLTLDRQQAVKRKPLVRITDCEPAVAVPIARSERLDTSDRRDFIAWIK